MDDQKIYTLVINGKPQGPFSLAELKENQISPNSFVRKPGMDDYKEAHEFPELRALLGFAEQHTAPQYFAGFDLRMLANAIDWFIIFGMLAFLELMIALYFNNRATSLITIIGGFILLPILKFFYHIYMEHDQQATFGKKMMNIKVTDLKGLKPTFSEVFVRNIAKSISTILFFFGYFYLFLNKQQQTLHDKMADTLVIKDRLI
ncbi:RDD family protein [Pedobacter sp. SD-b]|uniref:RDD family protein n=1 Tax=Pedobacter segetis TaxID=2793069 RepID=A0ABS1BH15_9SPHI|nr:RDD family protein [Pedobacter segetis]MBK0382148.1 RDD family protein [Pedobacter segetis]